MRKEILELEQKIGGSKVRSEIGEQNEYPRMRDYLWAASGSSTYGPTEMHKQSLANAEKIFIEIEIKLIKIEEMISPLLIQLKKISAPAIKD